MKVNSESDLSYENINDILIVIINISVISNRFYLNYEIDNKSFKRALQAKRLIIDCPLLLPFC